MNIVIRGMHGAGDSIHQRAVVRQLMERGPVFLETPWPAIYADLAGDRLFLLNKKSTLRTQAKNAARESAKFSTASVPRGATEVKVSYTPDAVRRLGSVLAAMMDSAGCDEARADFRLPIPDDWKRKAEVWVSRWKPSKPILVYRPLNERKEWGGCKARNPDFAAYAGLLRSIREQFFVVSVADFVPGAEWMVGEDIRPDVALHAGELDFETMAALVHRSALVFASPGFAVPLAQAVATPVVCVFGGYENSTSFSAGARFAPYLGIDPINPCQCWSHTHACDKRIDMPAATTRLKAFADGALGSGFKAGDAPSRVWPGVKINGGRPSITIKAAPAELPPFPPRYFNEYELDILVHLIGSVRPRTVVEFGCNEGRAAATILHNLPGIQEYVGIDVLPGYVTIRECQRKEVPAEPGKFAKDDPRFRLIVRKNGAFDLSPADLPACDAVFIDADHSTKGVNNDTALAKSLIRPGGVVIWHDDNRLPAVEVSETLDELARAGANIVHVRGTWLAFQRF